MGLESKDQRRIEEELLPKFKELNLDHLLELGNSALEKVYSLHVDEAIVGKDQKRLEELIPQLEKLSFKIVVEKAQDWITEQERLGKEEKERQQKEAEYARLAEEERKKKEEEEKKRKEEEHKAREEEKKRKEEQRKIEKAKKDEELKQKEEERLKRIAEE